jgi:glycosyltransferase involved in cell wall biosynthesis
MTPIDASTDKRRVLHVMRMTGVSGAENHLRELVRALRRRGWESDVLIPTPHPPAIGDFVDSLRRDGHRVVVARMRWDVSPALILSLQRMGCSGEYDVLHAHLVHADWHVAAARPLLSDLPLVTTKHNHDPFRTLWPVRLIERWSTYAYDEVIAISQSLASFTRLWTGVDATTVRYGLSAPTRPPVRPHAEPSLLAVGRLEPQKGLDVLVRAMPLVRGGVPEVKLLIAGEGPERQRLERIACGLGLQEAVRLLGRREDVPALMESATLLVHPARWEGFGLVLLEAMRSALPIVATAVGGIPEVIQDGVSGVLVPPEDPERLADAMLLMLREPDRARAMGNAGFARLREEFSPDRMADATAAVYERALRSGMRRGDRASGNGGLARLLGSRRRGQVSLRISQ